MTIRPARIMWPIYTMGQSPDIEIENAIHAVQQKLYELSFKIPTASVELQVVNGQLANIAEVANQHSTEEPDSIDRIYSTVIGARDSFINCLPDEEEK